MFDRLRFQYEIKAKGFTLNDVAGMLGINLTTLYRKMSGESDFFRHEIQILCHNIHFDNPMEIFFAEDLRKRKNNIKGD